MARPSKRGADNYLTHDNWDQEDKGEEDAGIFKKADDDTLKRRVIKRAARRMPASTNSGGNGGGAFAKFGGLKAPSTTTTASVKNQFAFLTKKSDEATKTAPTPAFSLAASVDQKSSDVDSSSQNKENVSEYNRHLAALNKSVSEWITKHVDKNPMCDLSPVFKDYKKHLNQIEEKYLSSQSESSQSTMSDSQESENKTSFKLTGFETKTSQVETKIEQAPVSTSVQKPVFSGFNTGTSSPFTGFDIGNKGSSGFSFSSDATSENKPKKEAEEESKKTDANAGETTEGDYQPPVAESGVIEEEGAIYTKRCKMFYSKDGNYVERGIGNIYLKKVEGKTQLLMRADTSLGNILLNVLLQPSMPTSRLGKNNVTIACVPNPPIDKEEAKLTTLLLRVKTSDDADELLKLIDENKSS